MAQYSIITGEACRSEATSDGKLSNRVYDLRIAMGDTVQSLQFAVTSDCPVLSCMADDRLLLLYIRRSRRLGVVANRTADWIHFLVPNRASRWVEALGLALAIAVIGYGLGGGVVRWLPPTVSIATFGPISVWVARRQGRNREMETDATAIAQLTAEQALMAKQHRVQTQIQRLSGEIAQNAELQDRFETLQRNMQDMVEYDPYLETVGKAAQLLQQQGQSLTQLFEGYQRLQRMLDIELEASQLVKWLPSETFLGLMTELERLEMTKEQLSAAIGLAIRN